MSKNLLTIVVLAISVVVYLSTYYVDQRERAILFRLGEIIDSDIGPGLHFKYPFINNVKTFDSRILTLNAQPESFLTVEKKNVTVDFFVKWRIVDVAQYYRATRGEKRNALSRLSQIMKDGLRNEFGKRTIKQVVSGERREVMSILESKSNKQAKEFGIKVIDVRLSRIDLPDDVSDSVYQRMRAERNRVAREFRARGKEQAERIRAGADRQRTETLAEAYRKAEEVKGFGDAQAAAIYADAYQRDEEFYSFVKSMNAYIEIFADQQDIFVLKPDSEFFRYFSKFKEPAKAE